MAYLLRKIRRSRWYKTEETIWLLEGELQADALVDLQTQSNALSVFHVNQIESNLHRVVAALAANNRFLSNFDFAIFGEEVVSESGINIKKSRGDSPDDQVNNWHSDLHELSAPKLLSLATQIKSKAKIERISHLQVLSMVADSLISGQIERSRIKWESQDDLDKLNRVVAERT
jgi:hypothetical protein